MKFKKLDIIMRKFETNNDVYITPSDFIIARLDGRSFSKLTKHKNFKKPFDEKFINYMHKTTLHLMNCGFNIIYGYFQSDEISLLFNKKERTFERKVRKINYNKKNKHDKYYKKRTHNICFLFSYWRRGETKWIKKK